MSPGYGDGVYGDGTYGVGFGGYRFPPSFPVLDRVYDALPEHYRTADEQLDWPLRRWIAGICKEMDRVDALRRRIDYDSDLTLPVSGPVTNLLNDPSLEQKMLESVDPAQWVVSADTAVTRSGRGRSNRFTTAGGAAMFSVSGRYVETPANLAVIPVDQGQVYTFGYSARTDTIGRSGVAELRWYNPDGGGTFYDGAEAEVVPLTVGGWTLVTMTDVPPAGATHAIPTITVISSAPGPVPNGEQTWVDDLIVVADDTLPVGYFDGDTASTPSYTFHWTGDPYASPSVAEPRSNDTSDLTDPQTADAEWLPWLAQLVGVPLTADMSEAERRDAVQYASSGWRAGTKSAIADAAKSALIGSRYAKVYDHSVASPGDGGVWDVLIVTRGTETPDVAAVLSAVIRRAAKPAGVVLRHRAYESEWSAQESQFPSWNAIEAAASWNKIQEVGL